MSDDVKRYSTAGEMEFDSLGGYVTYVDYAALAAELSAARAEVERMTTLCNALDATLQTWYGHHSRAVEECERLKAEVERLRGVASHKMPVQLVGQATEYPWGENALWVYPSDTLHPVVGRPGVYSITLGKTDDAAICAGHRSRIELYARRDFNVAIPAAALAPKEKL